MWAVTRVSTGDNVSTQLPASSAGVAPAVTDELPRRARRWLRRPSLPGGIRTRVLVWYVVLLMISIAIMVVGLRQILTTQLTDDIDAALAQEVEEVRRLAGGVDPVTGQPFGGDAAAIFDTFFLRSVPGDSAKRW